MSAAIRAIIRHLGSTGFDLVFALGFFLLSVAICVFVLFLLKYFGFFEIKDTKVNAELAEADTDFYRKNGGFDSDHHEKEEVY